MNKTAKKSTGHPRPVMRRPQQPEEDSPALWAKHLGKSLLITATAGMALTLILSLAAYFYPNPDSLIAPLALCAAGVTALIGGFSTVRIHGHSALLCGLLNGGAFTAVMMLLSLFFTSHSSGYSALISCLLHAGFLLLSVAGAYLGLGREKKTKKKR